MYQYGLGVPKGIAQAVTWYRKAAEQGYAPAQDVLARPSSEIAAELAREAGQAQRETRAQSDEVVSPREPPSAPSAQITTYFDQHVPGGPIICQVGRDSMLFFVISPDKVHLCLDNEQLLPFLQSAGNYLISHCPSHTAHIQLDGRRPSYVILMDGT